jgi:hypothetical protein
MTVKRLVLYYMHILIRVSYPCVMALNIHTGPVQRDGRTTL